jgi:hypothetical protein
MPQLGQPGVRVLIKGGVVMSHGSCRSATTRRRCADRRVAIVAVAPQIDAPDAA